MQQPDLDSDGDGCIDVLEAFPDPDGDGVFGVENGNPDGRIVAHITVILR